MPVQLHDSWTDLWQSASSSVSSIHSAGLGCMLALPSARQRVDGVSSVWPSQSARLASQLVVSSKPGQQGAQECSTKFAEMPLPLAQP